MKARITRVQRETIDATLREMADQGAMTPERVVKAAESPDSPLHAWFEWDDTKAASAYRIEQARALIRSVEVTVIIEDRPIEVSYFVRDPAQAAQAQGYVTLDTLRRQPDQAQLHLRAELDAVLSNLRRAEGYARVLHLMPELEQVRLGVRQLAARLEGVPLQ